MGIATFPNTVSPIKSIQRGSAVSAGNITISAVDVNKTMVNSFSTGSAGTVAASGTVNAASGSTSGTSTSGASSSWNDGFTYADPVTISARPETWYSTYNLGLFQGGRYGQTYYYQYTYFEIPRAIVNANINAQNINAANISLNSTSISGGSTNLTSAVYGAYLQDSTTLVVSGPCRYEVIEHY